MTGADINNMTFESLASLHDVLEGRRTPVGWSTEDSAMRASIERRMLEMVSSDSASLVADAGSYIDCAMALRVRSKAHATKGEARRLGIGGIEIDARHEFAIGTPVEIEVRSRKDEHGLRVRGRVAAVGPKTGIRVAFDPAKTAGHERRLRRFLLEALQHRGAV